MSEQQRTGIELDREFRRILAGVTPETSLQAAQELATLGIGPRAAFLIVCSVLTGAPA